MILDTLTHSERWEALGPRFATAFAWLRQVRVDELADGRHPLVGDEVFALVQRGLTKPLEAVKWEAHRRYADIQAVMVSREEMRWQALEKTRLGDYVAEKDFQALETDAWTRFEVEAGSFAVFFPTDAHRPGILVDGAAPVVKIVVKVLV